MEQAPESIDLPQKDHSKDFNRITRDIVSLLAVLIMPLIGVGDSNPFNYLSKEETTSSVVNFGLFAGSQVVMQIILLLIIIAANRETIYSLKWLPLGFVNEFLNREIRVSNVSLKRIIVTFGNLLVEIVIAFFLSIAFRMVAGIAFSIISGILDRFGQKFDYDLGAVMKPELMSEKGYYELMMFLSIVGGGFREELWRGLFIGIGSRLTGNRVWIPVVVSSVYFGALHLPYGVSAFIPLTVLGFLFAWVQVQLKSMRLAVYIHAIFNAAAIWLVFTIYNKTGYSPSQLGDLKPEEVIKVLEKLF